MTTIKETREALREQEDPAVTFKYYRLDGENQFSALTERLVEFLNPLNNKGDYLIIPQLDNALPVKPLRDWLKVCPAELVRVQLVKDYEYTAWHNRSWDTVTHAGLLVEYECDGMKTRAFFAAPGFLSDYKPGAGSLLLRLEFSNGLTMPEPEQEPEKPVTKSERMAALNVERARIRREYKPGPERDELLSALYTAFGNSQRKNPLPSWELPGIACGMNAHFNTVICERRYAHNVTRDLAPANIPQMSPAVCDI